MNRGCPASEITFCCSSLKRPNSQNTCIVFSSSEKLVTLKALDESILYAVDYREIESKIDESENFHMQIHKALGKLQSCQVTHDQQENELKQETHYQPKLSGNKSKLLKLQ